MPGSFLKKERFVFFCIVLMLGAFLLVGCEGDDGSAGAAGAQGPAGPAGPAGPPGPGGSSGGSVVDLATMTVEQQAELGTVSIPTDSISVTIASPPKVTFKLVDDLGRPVLGLDSTVENVDDRVIRFTLAKLVAGSNGIPDSWDSYLDGSYDSVRGGGTLVDNGNNTYTYTFATNVTIDPAYNPAATHRLAGQVGSGDVGFEPSNFVFDFVPAGGAVTHTRDVAMTASCNECHDPLNFHGRRREVGYCVTCHNPGLVEGSESLNMAPMVHKIHNADASYLGGAFAEVTYPQEMRNCRKCHSGDDAATPQGNNWRTTKPTRDLCFTQCHGVPEVVLEQAAFHQNIGLDDPMNPNACAVCHDNPDIVAAVDVDALHITPNATENNPGLLPGQRKIEYQIDRARHVGANLEIDFRILSDGTALNLTGLPAGLSGSPSFLFAYANSQDGITAPADFNNLGKTAGQPDSISVSNLANGSAGTLACTAGTCTATIPNPFTAGATMRTVGLQGYYTQNVSGESIALHTRSVVKTVAGQTARRTIVVSSGCANCHEVFEGHGGNREFTAEGGLEICTMCHNPNLSSSGRAINPVNAANGTAAGDLGTTDTFTWPEATNNLKDMIHGIHASDFRNTDYEFVRNRQNGIYYNWSEVTFPGNIANCTKCHMGDAYIPDMVPENSLITTNRTTGVASGMDATFTDVGTARANVPNPTDWIITPVSAACYSCHDSQAATAHMELSGGSIDVNRDSIEVNESCAVCHGLGNIADVDEAHNL